VDLSETREQLKARIFAMIDKVFENHLDNIQIIDEEFESIYCEKGFMENGNPIIPCPEPQTLASFDSCPTRTLKIEISYVRDAK
jgi:hypothetical protein